MNFQMVQPNNAPPDAVALARVFPRRNKATPNDPMAFFGPPDLFVQADEVHVDVTFIADKARIESLAEDWKHLPSKSAA